VKRRVFLPFFVFIAVFAGTSAASPSSREASYKDRLVQRLQADLVNQEYNDAPIVLDELVKLDPTNYQFYNLRGVVKERIGRYSDATPSYAKALELQPGSATVRLNLALNYLRLERFSDAAKEFSFLIDRATVPTEPVPNRYQQAPVGAELERFARSMRAEEIQYSSLGRLFLSHRLAEAALTIFFAGTQVLPQSSALYYGLGWSFQELGKFEEAQASFQRALHLRPDYYECCLRLGYSFLSLKNTEKAVQTYQDCVRMNPESYTGHYFLGLALMRGMTARTADAISHLEQAVKLNPHSLDSRLELGKAYSAEGSDSRALREFSIVAAENPENEEAHYRLAMLYKASQQTAKAREHLERFETLKARELARMREESLLSTIGLSQPSLGKTADAVVAFYSTFKTALSQRNFGEVWNMLTDRSKTLYHDDPKRFVETVEHLRPDLINRISRSSISGGKLVSGRIVCDLLPVDGISLPPLVLIEDGDKLRIDYGFDLSLAGLAYLGARNSGSASSQ
jgi:tetratricopeptide (TPR) repeat protein